MAPEIESQGTDDVYEVIGANDGRDAASMDQFIEQLESGFEYPALATLVEDANATPTGDEPDPEEVEEEEGEEPDPNEPDPNAAQTPNTVLVNGQEVSLEDVKRLYEFDQFLRANPDAAQRVQAAVQPAVPAPTETPTPANQEQELTPPEFLDLEDPAQKFMWESYVTQQKQLNLLTTTTVQQQQAVAEREANARAVSEMDQALAQWKTAHPNFNEDQIIEVRKHAAGMNLIDSLIATSPNGVAALVRAMDLAALDSPDLRTVYLDPETHRTQTRAEKSATRKGKLNSLGGSTGSAPRTTSTPRPTTDREARDQFAKGLEDSFTNQ